MKTQSTMTSEETRDTIIRAAEDKKANYTTAIELRGKTLIADFFIICSGTSNIHIRAIADGIMEEMEKLGVRQRRIEGYSEASWILLDYGDNIVHIMSEEQRSYYKLEALWGGASAPSIGPEEDEDEDQEFDEGFGEDEDEPDDEEEDYDEEDEGEEPTGELHASDRTDDRSL